MEIYNVRAKKCKKNTLFFLFAVLIFSFSFSSYNIVDPWNDRVWLNGWYTAAVCIGQNENLTPYTPAVQPDLPNGSIVCVVGDMNNYISYGSEGAYYNRPERYSYECDCECDDDGCSCHTCYGCRYRTEFVTVSSLGFSAGAWNVDTYRAALEKIDYGRWANATLTGDRDGVAAELQNALRKYLELVQLYNACRETDTYSAANYLANTYGDINVRRWISYTQYLALIHPNQPSLPGEPCSITLPKANGAACKEYPVKWMETARSAMTAFAKSLLSADKNTELLRQQYEQADHAGLCEADYNENPKTACLRMREALAVISQKTKEATYGQIALALEKRKSLQQKIYCFPPDFSDYDAAMEYLWDENGFNPKMVRLRGDGAAAFAEANEIYADYQTKAVELRNSVNEAKNALENEKLHLITEAVAVDVFEKTKIGTIAERFDTWKQEKEKADASLSAAANIMKRKDRGYLKNATAEAKKAASAYGLLESSAVEIKDDAASVVKEKKDAASGLLQQLAGFQQRNSNAKVAYYYQQAGQAMARGDAAKTLGDKYSFYAASINYARTGLNNGQMIENETMPLAQQLADLIRRAEIDGINAGTEKSILDSMERNSAYDQELLRRCIESILTKASIKYGNLSDKKAELLQMIGKSGDCGADLAGDLKRVDGGLVGTTGIDYINAIGKMKKIGEEYALIENELVACKEKIALADINVETIINNGGVVKIDEPVRVSVFLIITNLGPQTSMHVGIPVDLGINASLLLSDITGGRENVESVRNEGTKTIFTIKEIKPMRTFSINAEKNVVLAKTLSAERTAAGIESRNREVEITEKRRIEAFASGRLVLPVAASSMTIDGKNLNYIGPGLHEVALSYRMRDAYTTKEEIETVKLGNLVQIKKKIAIKPAIDIARLSFYVPLGYKNASTASVSSLDAMITNKTCEGTGCSFDISNLKANKTITIFVEFMVNDALEEAAGISVTLPDTADCFGSGKRCGELPPNLQMKIAGINAAKEANDSTTALRLKEEYEALVGQWEAQQRENYDKIGRTKDKIVKEKMEIEDAIKLAKSNSTLLQELKKRKELIEETLERAQKAQTLGEELQALEEIENNDAGAIISGSLQNGTAQYNELKERLAKTGETGTPLPFIAVEQKISELEFTGEMAAAVELTDALVEAGDYVRQREAEIDRKLSDIDNEYLLLRANITRLAKEYREQQDEAKNTEWESIFDVDAERMERISEEVEGAIEEKNYALAKMKIEQLQKQAAAVNGVLEQAKSEAEMMLVNARNAYLGRREGMSLEARGIFESGINNVAETIANKKYVGALKLAKQLINEISSYQPETINIWLVAAAVILAAAAILVYHIKKKEGGIPGESGLRFEIPGFTKKIKEYRKLERLNE